MLRYLQLFSVLVVVSYSVCGKTNYAGKYYGSYTKDSCKISVTLNLAGNGHYTLSIKMINTNTNKDYFDKFYLIPLQTEGKWFVRKGLLFLSEKTKDSVCHDGQTRFYYNFILKQDSIVNKKKFYRVSKKFQTQTRLINCSGDKFLCDERYSCYEFRNLSNNKPALEIGIFADFYEQIWNGEGTFLVRE